MALLNKQDSNFTALSYAYESSPGILPGTPVWQPLEPNDYKNFGGSVVTKARKPINPSRQLKKGVVVDLNAEGGFHQDITSINLQDLMQAFMFANLRTKSELTPTAIATNLITVAAGGTAYFAGDLGFLKGASAPANAGLLVVTGSPGATSIPVTGPGLVAETPPTTAVFSRVGTQFGAGELTIDVSGAFPKIVSGAVAASDVLTAAGQPANADTVTVGGVTYTFQTALVNAANNVLIGGSAQASLANLRNAINRDGLNGVPGTDFGTATVANPLVSAVSGVSTLTASALIRGAAGNAIAATKVSANLTWAAATLLGGSGRDVTTMGLIPGEFIYVGDDAAGNSFINSAVNTGFCRIRSLDGSGIVLDKTQFTMVADAGTAKTVRLYIGRALKNESVQNLIVRKSVQLERTLGYVDDTLQSQIQAEYVTGCFGSTWELDGKSGDILTADYTFLGRTYETRASGVGVKSGTRAVLQDSDAFNATSNVKLIRMAVVSSNNSAPTPLFAFLTDFKLNLKNNLKTNKAVSVLGAFDVTAGFFQVGFDVTAYFQNVAAVQSVVNNDSVTVEMHFTKANKGLSIDLPLIAMSKSLVDIKQDEPVTLPLSSDAASGNAVSTNLNHTMMLVFWDYLPSIAN